MKMNWKESMNARENPLMVSPSSFCGRIHALHQDRRGLTRGYGLGFLRGQDA